MLNHQTHLGRLFYTLSAIFVLGALIYDLSHLYFGFNGELFSESISLNIALEQIPTCTTSDRSRHRSLLYALQAWNHLADEYDIQYWIGYSSLVGYVERHGLLPHDQDIDIFIMAQDTSRLIEISQLNVSSIYQIKIHPQWHVVEVSKRSYFFLEGIDFIEQNARFIHKNDSNYINIWLIYNYHPNQTRMEKNNTLMLTEYDHNYNWRSSPKNWTFPLQKCMFSGINIWCPAQPEKLVAKNYGTISLNISSIKCINGSWERSDEMTTKNLTSPTTKTFQ